MAHCVTLCLLLQTWIIQQMYSEYVLLSWETFLCCSVVIAFIFPALSSKNTLVGRLSGGSLRAVCHGHVRLHDRHRDGGTSWYCWFWVRRWEHWQFSLFSTSHINFLHACVRHAVHNSLNVNYVYFFSKGDDMESLLFHFLDDWLYKFNADLFFVPRVSMLISYQL